MSEQTHKWLPSEPTEEMIEAAYYEWKYRPHASMKSAIKHMIIKAWQAAPQIEQEPIGYAWIIGSQIQKLSDVKLNDSFEPIYTQPQPNRDPLDNETILGIAATIPNLSGDNNALIDFAKKLGV